VPLLRRLDDELAEEVMPPGARHRVAAEVRARLEAHENPRRWLPMVTFACGAALVLLVVAIGAWRLPSETASPGGHVARQSLPPAATLGAFTVQGSGCTVAVAEGGHRLEGDCRMIAPHMTVTSWTEAVVLASGTSVRLKRGRALFDVEPVRPEDVSVRVDVSGGTIEVVGTRFEVQQDDEGGYVDLFEGKIRFHEPGGNVVHVRPGTRHAWTVAPVRPVPEPEEPVEVEIFDEAGPVVRAEPRKPRRSAAEAAELIERVDRLRRAGRAAEGIGLLEAAVGRRWDRRTAQVLSFELGELLHRHASDARACEHFAAHQRKFPRGRYHAAVQRARQRLDCE
jgi:hypothetical protein